MQRKQKAPAMLGLGLYSIAEAAELVGAPLATVRRWLQPEEQLVKRTFAPNDQTLTFLELMELHFIHMFRAEGVPLEAIRKAALAAARKFKTDYPFAIRRFDTDGKTIFATLIDEERDALMVEDLKRGQHVFEQIMRPFFRKLEYHGLNEATRYWPLTRSGRVVLDPRRHFGKPIDETTGVPTRALYEAVQSGEDAPVVAEWFGVPLDAVLAAVKFEQSLAAAA